MNPGAGRAGHRLVAIRPIGRCRFGQVDLNVQTGPVAPENVVGHLAIFARYPRGTLICLKAILTMERGSSPPPILTPANGCAEHSRLRGVVRAHLENGEAK